MKRFFSFLIIPITLISIISLFSDLFSKRIIEKTINITEDRHYLLILESFHIITESMQNLLVGIGDGNLQDRTGYYTFLPPHGMLNSYLTVLVHRGVIGFISVYFLYGYLLFKILNKFLYNSGINSKIFLFTYINILIAFFFYELRFVIPVWAFLAILATYVFNYENYERYS